MIDHFRRAAVRVLLAVEKGNRHNGEWCENLKCGTNGEVEVVLRTISAFDGRSNPACVKGVLQRRPFSYVEEQEDREFAERVPLYKSQHLPCGLLIKLLWRSTGASASCHHHVHAFSLPLRPFCFRGFSRKCSLGIQFIWNLWANQWRRYLWADEWRWNGRLYVNHYLPRTRGISMCLSHIPCDGNTEYESGFENPACQHP